MLTMKPTAYSDCASAEAGQCRLIFTRSDFASRHTGSERDCRRGARRSTGRVARRALQQRTRLDADQRRNPGAHGCDSGGLPAFAAGRRDRAFLQAIAYFERLRQVEAQSERISLFYEPITFLLTSEGFSRTLRTKLVEGLPPSVTDRARAVNEIDRLPAVLEQRRAVLMPGGPQLGQAIGALAV
jgi:hypothetical protein